MKVVKRVNIDAIREGPAKRFFGNGRIIEVMDGTSDGAQATAETVVVYHQLQYAADYRGAIQDWFRSVELHGHLISVVSHAFLYERNFALPAVRDPMQRRLYTPRSLLDEVEEALEPNSYRVRLLCDLDGGYDYDLPAIAEPSGDSDILLVLEKIAMPRWALGAVLAPTELKSSQPDYAFEPPHTRVEVLNGRRPLRICALKLDHLGDFLMGMPTFAKLREAFPDAHITFVVGSWNVALAEDVGFADRIIAFDAFPRNSSEEEVDVPGRVALFRAAVTGRFDLAIDLRTDTDTRILLRAVDADLRAGIGSRAAFPFLDIFLPIDGTRNEAETAREFRLSHHDFSSQGPARRNDFRTTSSAGTVERFCAIVWGPYWRLKPGSYFFEPFIELGRNPAGGVVMIDIGLDAQRVVHQLLPTSERLRLPFVISNHEQAFEFRIWAVEDTPSIDLSFFGGRLVREGANSVLHQSEYSSLLVALIKMRLERNGMLDNVAVR